jgi:hypothetical protein
MPCNCTGPVDILPHSTTSALDGSEWSTLVPGFTPEERTPGTHFMGGCLSQEHIWSFLRTYKLFDCARNQTHFHPGHSPVTISTELSQVPLLCGLSVILASWYSPLFTDSYFKTKGHGKSVQYNDISYCPLHWMHYPTSLTKPHTLQEITLLFKLLFWRSQIVGDLKFWLQHCWHSSVMRCAVSLGKCCLTFQRISTAWPWRQGTGIIRNVKKHSPNNIAMPYPRRVERSAQIFCMWCCMFGG